MASGQSSGSNSIIVGNCVACAGLVRVSAKTNANADVRCPHCQQTFSLARLLESAVPEVEIVQPESGSAKPQSDLYIDQTAETGKDASGKFVVPSQLAKGARRRKSSRRSGSSRGRSESGRSSRSGSERGERGESGSSSSHRSSESSRHRNSDSFPNESRGKDSEYLSDERTPVSEVTAETNRSDSARNGAELEFEPRESRDYSERSDRSRRDHEPEIRSHRSTRHRDKRLEEESDADPSSAATFFKMLLGGLLALPIAYMIVMWIFGQDPLGVGKQLGERVPFVVPAAFRAKPEEASETLGQEVTALEDEEVQEPNGFDPDFSNLKKIGEYSLEGLDQ